jgi:hypothetical protein
MPLGGDISTIDVDNDAILLVVVLEVKWWWMIWVYYLIKIKNKLN